MFSGQAIHVFIERQKKNHFLNYINWFSGTGAGGGHKALAGRQTAGARLDG